MNITEKLKLKVICRLISNKSYRVAIKRIDTLIPETTCIRKCINLKVQCLLELERYEEAHAILKDRFPYVMVDDDDLTAIKYLSIVHQKLGNDIQAKKYSNSYNILSETKEERENILHAVEEESNQVYNDFLSNDDSTPTETIENIIIDNIQMLRITEAAVYSALAKRNGINISDDIKDVFTLYTQADKFAQELTAATENKYCVISESACQSKHVKGLLFCKGTLKARKQRDSYYST